MHRSSPQDRRAPLAVLAAVLLVVAAACTTIAGRATPASQGPTSAAALSVSPGAGRTHVHDVGTSPAPAPDLRFLSDVYDLTPSGPLAEPATITLRLANPVPQDDAVVVATRERTGDPWSYLPAQLSADRATVTFTTTHLSFFGLLGYSLSNMIKAFKTDFIDGIDGGATQSVAKPSCAGESQARGDGYRITSDSTDAVYWCFGEDGGKRILKVTDHRRYPLLVAHPNMRVISNDYDRGQLSSLSKLASGANAIIAPGATAVFDADLQPGDSEGIQTQFDGLGQSLYAIQAGATALVQILTRFGVGSGIRLVDTINSIVAEESCADSLGKGSGAVIAGCFSAKDILDAFGVKGLLIAPIMVAGPVIAFFRSEWNALVDQFNGHSVYRIALTRAKPALSLSAFVGQWIGHTRIVTITASGHGTESIGDGCCDPVIDLSFQLSNPNGTATDATATMTVTSVTLHDWPSDEPAPTVGQRGTLRLSQGVITEPITQANYCDTAAGEQGTCGA